MRGEFFGLPGDHWPVIVWRCRLQYVVDGMVARRGGIPMGISVYDYEWSQFVILVFFCLFLLPSIIAARLHHAGISQRRYDVERCIRC